MTSATTAIVTALAWAGDMVQQGDYQIGKVHSRHYYRLILAISCDLSVLLVSVQ
jgi:hypothetical protein